MGQARELMDRVSAALLTNDADVLREVYAPDVVATTPDMGTLQGVDQVVEWSRQFVSAFSNIHYETMANHETADCAIDQGDLVATHSAAFELPGGETIPATGKQMRLRSVDIAKVEGDRIVRHDFYWDQLEMMSQLGLMEAPAQAT